MEENSVFGEPPGITKLRKKMMWFLTDFMGDDGNISMLAAAILVDDWRDGLAKRDMNAANKFEEAVDAARKLFSMNGTIPD